MAGAPSAPENLSARELVARLEALHAESEAAVLAFDGDGTLWSGDVGEDVFHYFTSHGLLRDEAGAALAREATSYGLDARGTPTELARRLFQAYLAEIYPERAVCAMMSWCYAGYTPAELAAHVRAALEAARLSERLHHELEPVFDFARARGVRAVVISASPTPVVEDATRLWRIAAGDIAACTAAIEGGRLAPKLAAPVPYAEDKPKALAALAGDRRLLASFGDNVFDVELLRAARLAVAVRPKPALRVRLGEVPGIVVLSPLGG